MIVSLFGQPGFLVHLRMSSRKIARQSSRSISEDAVTFEAWYFSSGSGSEIVGLAIGAVALYKIVSATEVIGLGCRL